MDLSPYVDSVRAGVNDAAALADDHTRHVAERLGSALDAATRLALINALSDAADTISADLAPGSVALRMSGPEPEFDVSLPSTGTARNPRCCWPNPTNRPSPRRSISTMNRWLESASAFRPRSRPRSTRWPTASRSRPTRGCCGPSWMHSVTADRDLTDGPYRRNPPDRRSSPPSGPFGPHGVFGEHGPFGPGGVFGRPEPADQAGAPTAPGPCSGLGQMTFRTFVFEGVRGVQVDDLGAGSITVEAGPRTDAVEGSINVTNDHEIDDIVFRRDADQLRISVPSPFRQAPVQVRLGVPAGSELRDPDGFGRDQPDRRDRPGQDQHGIRRHQRRAGPGTRLQHRLRHHLRGTPPRSREPGSAPDPVTSRSRRRAPQ